MRTTGATHDYTDGPKKHWVRWGWNRVVDRAGVLIKAWPTLYLAGPQDNDRAIAIAKGVPPTNLIAIDRYSPNVGRVRRAGGVAICADAIDVLWAWPAHRPVAAIALDFCCGLERDLARELVFVLCREPFANAVVWLNLLRGRDASTNFLRDDVEQIFDRRVKHRGALFFYLMVLFAGHALNERGQLKPEITPDVIERAVARKRRPQFNSYKSRGDDGGVNVYDSIVFDAHPSGRYYALRRQARGKPPIPRDELYHPDLAAPAPAILRAKRLVSAALAVRTMREDR